MDLGKSLQDLGEKKLDDPGFDSNLVRECLSLYKTPLGKLTAENLRLLIGQKIGLSYTVPLALSLLEDNPTISGDMYYCDLVLTVAKLPDEFWESNPDLNNRVVEITHEAESLAESLNEALGFLRNRTFL